MWGSLFLLCAAVTAHTSTAWPQRDSILSDLTSSSDKIFNAYLSGSDTSDEIVFTRQQAWTNWSPKIVTDKAPNCMRSKVNDEREIAATFCFYKPVLFDNYTLADYNKFTTVIPVKGVGIPAAKLGKSGDPRKLVTVFGNAGSYAAGGLLWGNPTLDGYSTSQGWLLFPLSSPSTDGSSQPWRTSKERIEFCATNPDKCKNIYRTVKISGGFGVGLSVAPRPQEEVATVEWALSYSKDNTNTNSVLLDRGYFSVFRGIISVNERDPRSKSIITNPITISDFSSNQHVALWMRISTSMIDPNTRLQDVENNGYLNITDMLSFRVVGNCKISCDNGGQADLKLCTCLCPANSYWTGKFCEKCSLQCANGQLDKACTTCTCQSPWNGTQCDVCNRQCASGKLDPVSCTCKCQGNWEGESCNACSLTCKNGGVLDPKTCTCTCPSGSSWVGNQCEVCNRQCSNGGVLNPQTCTCSCAAPWSGPICQTCTIKCYNGARVTPQCTCTNIKLPWGGDFGEKCLRKCSHGGTIQKSGPQETPCTCQCIEPWAGDECEVCPKTCNGATSVSTLPNTDCSCTCRNNWQGRYCDYCPLFNSMKNGGTVYSDCSSYCPSPWTGPDCSICSINCLNGGTVLGPTSFNPYRCKCSCPSGYSGTTCEKKI